MNGHHTQSANTGPGLTLPSLDNGSSSSLMDAVVGGAQRPAAGAQSTLSSVSEAGAGAGLAPRANGNATNGGNKDVSELELNLQKRRSLIPHLENELAELEAQIKAAEERLAAAGSHPAAATAQ